MATRIKIKRGAESSIKANKGTLEQYEIVYATNTGKLGIREPDKQYGLDTEDGIVWFVPKDTFKIEMGKGAISSPTGYNAIAIGEDSFSDTRSVAVGYRANSAPYDGIAIGTLSTVKVSARGGVALGNSAEVSASKSIAIGQNAKATTSNTVQLGGNTEDFTLNAGNKPVTLQGDITVVDWTYGGDGGKVNSFNLTSYFSTKPKGTFVEIIGMGTLDSGPSSFFALKINEGTSTRLSVTNVSTSLDYRIFSLKLVKVGTNQIIAFAPSYGDVVGSDSYQRISLTNATIKWGGDRNYEDNTMQLFIKAY